MPGQVLGFRVLHLWCICDLWRCSLKGYRSTRLIVGRLILSILLIEVLLVARPFLLHVVKPLLFVAVPLLVSHPTDDHFNQLVFPVALSAEA